MNNTETKANASQPDDIVPLIMELTTKRKLRVTFTCQREHSWGIHVYRPEKGGLSFVSARTEFLHSARSALLEAIAIVDAIEDAKSSNRQNFSHPCDSHK